MRLKHEFHQGLSEKDYENLLKVKLSDKGSNEEHKKLLFSVTPNFDIFITYKPHAYLEDTYGINPDTTLTEGYIRLTPAGEFKEIRFKPTYQPNPGFTGTREELEHFKEAVSEKIRKTFPMKN